MGGDPGAAATTGNRISPEGHLIHDTLSAHLHPRQACDALVAALGALGCRGHRSGPGPAVLSSGPPASRGSRRWATGTTAAWAAASRVRRHCCGYRRRGAPAAFRRRRAHHPASRRHRRHRLDVREQLRSMPPRTDAQLDDVIAAARAAVPALRDAPVIARWAGVRPRAAAARRCWAPGRAARSLHRQRRLQDRLRHGAQGGAGHGRSDAGGVGQDPAGLSRRGQPLIPPARSVRAGLPSAASAP